MSERPTPETDALWHSLNTGKNQPSWWAVAEKMRDLANRIERERDEFRAQLEIIKPTPERLERERDEARNLADAFHRDQVTLLLERDKAREDATNYYSKIGELEHERDKARLLARILYSVGCELRRFTQAYAFNYDEADGKEGALNAIRDLDDASKHIEKILGPEGAK